MNWLVIMFWASGSLSAIVGYWLGYSDGRMSGWVDGYCDRPLKGKEPK